MPKKVDITGKIFGRLTVVKEETERSSSNIMWLCKCECGNEIIVYGNNIKSGKTNSCGCWSIESHTKHGMTNSGEYISWKKMRDRCTNPKHESYANYGGRGIKVCDRWLNSFEDFFADMGLKPSTEHTLDRFPDRYGDYELSNCRWATEDEQKRNRTNNVWVEYKGEKLILNDWATKLGITPPMMRWKFVNKGWGIERIIQHYKK